MRLDSEGAGTIHATPRLKQGQRPHLTRRVSEHPQAWSALSVAPRSSWVSAKEAALRGALTDHAHVDLRRGRIRMDLHDGHLGALSVGVLVESEGGFASFDERA
jgi:hypothetical protein